MNGEVCRLPNGNIIARRGACSYALSEADNRSRAPHPLLLPSCMRRSRCSSFAAGIPCEIALKELARLYLRLEKGSPWPALGRQALSVPFTSEARALKWNAASGYSLGRFSTSHVQGTETEPTGSFPAVSLAPRGIMPPQICAIIDKRRIFQELLPFII